MKRPIRNAAICYVLGMGVVRCLLAGGQASPPPGTGSEPIAAPSREENLRTACFSRSLSQLDFACTLRTFSCNAKAIGSRHS